MCYSHAEIRYIHVLLYICRHGARRTCMYSVLFISQVIRSGATLFIAIKHCIIFLWTTPHFIRISMFYDILDILLRFDAVQSAF